MIAYVEGDPEYGEFVKQVTEAAGHRCRLFVGVEALRRACSDTSFKLLIVDIGPANGRGDDAVTWIRETLGPGAPILALTTTPMDDVVIASLAAGADECAVRSDNPQLLLARVDALLRRGQASQAENKNLLRIGRFWFDLPQKCAYVDGVDAELAPREFGVAYSLFKNFGKLVARASIERSVWGRVIGPDSRTLDVHVSKVRTKLQLNPTNGVRLLNVYGMGFRLIHAADEAVILPKLVPWGVDSSPLGIASPMPKDEPGLSIAA